ncbi:hypothetical protein ERICIV_01733 [Paenibacillus larvae subsp. larvae]|uniref:DUF3885 domain-containing protein n=1 Tax=Paenibacillus larvae subsp. larvae TaxID=147375 RepID=A0A2L1TYY3_9BACL|nr:DUF3885 domain-containing protein [Paenibacillus larvae]AQZ47980.1 hypothetical protein B5S25_16680 [Paenibacillus larvae subsp. pulvifaciens]AVF25890.1 hypothetical protein ERICIII_01712 [Paenibacillus larvae subsp. larvae]AVF30667.1 hypothetical protein ERICIV_01733 [Paenibacillus larvae subsp. larvae]MCY7522300.1 DUF3885 domain-containing protein [Paenibacillus larvae]MCY9503237.1 DUF3885 domain-containing protein [Paenibacillus larvae]
MNCWSELDEYILDKFGDLELKKPLFYNARYGLRFDLGSDLEINQGRVEQVYYRSKSLFYEINSNEDELFFVIFADFWNDEPMLTIKDEVINVFQNYLKDFSIAEINQVVIPYRYKEDDEDDTMTLRVYIKRKVKDIKLDDLLVSMADGNVYGDIYLINSKKHVIYDLYDDRGLDIISCYKESLYKLYTDYNNWILEYDRKRIDKIFLS